MGKAKNTIIPNVGPLLIMVLSFPLGAPLFREVAMFCKACARVVGHSFWCYYKEKEMVDTIPTPTCDECGSQRMIDGVCYACKENEPHEAEFFHCTRHGSFTSKQCQECLKEIKVDIEKSMSNSIGQVWEPEGPSDHKKAPLNNIPSTAKREMSYAFLEGELKYGRYNWRMNRIKASDYLSAAIRHMDRYNEGETYDPDTLVHHLAYAMTRLAIIIDAEACGRLIDDRPEEPIGASAALLRGQDIVERIYKKFGGDNA